MQNDLFTLSVLNHPLVSVAVTIASALILIFCLLYMVKAVRTWKGGSFFAIYLASALSLFCVIVLYYTVRSLLGI